MQVTVFSAKLYEHPSLEAAASRHGHTVDFQPLRLYRDTASLALGTPAVSAFVHDILDAETLGLLARQGVRLVALRCAGFNQVDLKAAEKFGVTVARVPAYSPQAVAEHTLALLLALLRKLCRAHNRVREGNFSLDGLLGEGLCGKTAGIVGTGKIGTVVARILNGFGCRLLGYDPAPSTTCEKLGMTYTDLPHLLEASDIVTLHCPLTPGTRHLLGEPEVARMKPGAVLINTSRGAVLDTQAVIRGLKSGRIGALGLDVYEEEDHLFFEDLSGQIIQDDVFARLMTFPNVLITGHQGFFTREALEAIADVTFRNVSEFELTGKCANAIAPARRVSAGSNPKRLART